MQPMEILYYSRGHILLPSGHAGVHEWFAVTHYLSRENKFPEVNLSIYSTTVAEN